MEIIPKVLVSIIVGFSRVRFKLVRCYVVPGKVEPSVTKEGRKIMESVYKYPPCVSHA